MANQHFHERQFFDALRDIFVGAEIEGESGFINLMKIKSRYYQQGVFPRLKQDIDRAVEDFPEFREELFDKLYTFFQRYFSESGSIYFRYTPLHQNIYEKIYTDDRDVVLFWKTHMLYYVKTDCIFKSLKVEVDEVQFYFDASNIEHKRANERRDVVFSFREVAPNGTLVFDCAYSVRGRITKIEQILRDLRKKDVYLSDETLEKAFRVFEKQSEVDYFINKNARAFLEEQFDLWLYQYLFAEKNIWSAERIAQLQVLKEIAYKIIGFISQFEDELVKIWNKPKFVRNSHYIITLNHFFEKERIDLIKTLFAHDGMGAQMKEWVELGMLEPGMESQEVLNQINATDLIGDPLHSSMLNLPLDSIYFSDLETKLLSIFDSMDDELDGWLIHSENYQGLNSIFPKFLEKVQTIYIDPPFNLDSSDQFSYRTNYKDANWASLLENRIRIAKAFLSNTGNIFVRCDYNGNWIVRNLMDQIYSEVNFRNELVINKSNKQGAINTRFNPATETLFLYSKDPASLINPQFRDRDTKIKWLKMHSPKENKDSHTVVFDGKTFISPKGRHWTFSQDTTDQMSKENRIRVVEYQYTDVFGENHGEILEYLMSEKETIDSDWTDIPAYSSTTGFQTENSEKLLERVINTGSKESDLVMDFFLGSGTTATVAHKINRKWLGIEMGEHFYDVILPRLKLVLFGEKSGISKEVNWTGGGFFKYFDLEQYEDTLQKVHYEDADLFDDPNQDPYHSYVFLRDLKLLDSLEVDPESDRVKFHPERLYPDIDLAETLSHLRGKWIKRITETYVEFEDGECMSLTDPDWETLKPMIWWQ